MADYLKLDAAKVARHIEQLFVDFRDELEGDEALRADLLEGETHLHALLARIVDHRAEAEETIAGIKERASHLTERKDRYERRKEALTALALRLMQVAKQPKITLPEATLSVSAGKDSVIVDDEAKLPQGFTRTKTEPNKTAIGEALKAGQEVPGAYLQKGSESLVVRRK